MSKSNLIIYEPKGAALEYSLLALNHYIGCPFACTYCYCPGVLHMTREAFHHAAIVKENILARVVTAARKYTGTNRRVLLCFAGDPYPDCDAAPAWTRKILQQLKLYDVPWQVLTKAGPLAQRDFNLYRPDRDAFAVTLTTLDKHRAAEIERGAAPPADRIETLKEAYKRGIETWVSLEPVLDPADAIEIIRQTADFVHLYKIGTLNHARPALAEPREPVDWSRFVMRAIHLCTSRRCKYYIKSSLARKMSRLAFDVPFENTDNRLAGWRAES